MKKLATGLGGAIGGRYLKNKNRLVFAEYNGFISKVDLTATGASIVSQGSVLIKGTYILDCETGAIGGLGTSGDIFWEQVNTTVRTMNVINGALIVNLGTVDFNAITPATIGLYNYGTTGINGNNDASNKLVVNDVFCVLTNVGNYCKCKVTAYGYDLKIDYVTYKLNPTYAHLGSGYNQPEDIAVLSNETTAYVTERAGDIIMVDLNNANRNPANVICSGLTAPQQLWVDEAHKQAYTVEFANSGRLVRVDLATHVVTPIYSGLAGAIGLIVSSDLSYAYISEQNTGSISRIDLTTRVKTTIATGIAHPFFLSWADENETALLVADRDPDNKIVLVDISKTSGNVTNFIMGTATRPSSVARINPGMYCVCCDGEVDLHTVYISNGLYMGIGNVPVNLINAGGFADTTGLPTYSWQFPKNSPFGGTLPVMIEHRLAFDSGIRYYRVSVNGVARHDSWTDVRLDPVTGMFTIPVPMNADANGLYDVQNPVYIYYHDRLGCPLDSTDLTNGAHTLTVQFFDAGKNLVSTMGNTLFIDNNKCVASLSMPSIGGQFADADCGYLKYVNTTDVVTVNYSATEPMGYCSWSFSIIRGAGNGVASAGGAFPPGGGILNGVWTGTVQSMFGANCAVKGVAGFGMSLYVASAVIDGVSRQSQYDASRYYAFALAK